MKVALAEMLGLNPTENKLATLVNKVPKVYNILLLLGYAKQKANSKKGGKPRRRPFEK